MAERVMLVCDTCGKPASETVGIRAGGRSLQKDVCDAHLAELTNGARQARRGRPRGSTSKRAAASGPRKKAAARSPRKKTASRKKSSRKKAARRGRPRSRSAAAAG